jgi:outer membrane murein-binding lipoprotein Lpp
MKKTILAAAIVSIVGLSGCASTGSEQSANQENTSNVVLDDAAALADKRVKESAGKVEQNYLSAANENYAYYAPEHWKTVNSELEEMRSLVAEFDPNDQGFFGGPAESDVIEQIDNTQASLEAAQRIKGLVSQFLAQAMADVEYLSPQIKTQWKNDFAQIKRSISGVIAEIEDEGKTAGLETRRATIQGRLLQLEIKIVKSNVYTPLFKQMGNLNKVLIPQSYLQVKKDLVQLNDTIGLSPRNAELIQKLVAGIDNDLIRARNVSLEVNWINSVNRAKSETIALRYRNALEKMAVNMIGKDISSLSFADQISTLESELNHKSAQVAEVEMKKSTEQTRLISGLRAQLDAVILASKSADAQVTLDAEPAVLTTQDIVELSDVGSNSVELDTAAPVVVSATEIAATETLTVTATEIVTDDAVGMSSVSAE